MRPAAAILSYHSLTTIDSPSASVVNVPAFECIRALTMLGTLSEIVPLREVVDRQRAGRSTRGLAAVTFDDAYASLPPLLGDFVRARNIPITVFATIVGANGSRFWWDRIDDLFPRVDPARWRAFEDEIGLPAAFRDGQPPAFGPLRPLRQWVLAVHAGRWPTALEPSLARLEAEAGFSTTHHPMTWSELAAFATGSIDVGVHTVTHPVLPLLDDVALIAEIRNGFAGLREHIPTAQPLLAVPFGLFDERTVRLAHSAGMHAALTLGNRTLRRTDILELPRLSMTRGYRAWRFLARLGGLRRGGTARYPALPSATT